MKKNILTIILSITIGFLMTKFTYSQYKTDYSLKTVFNNNDELIFIKYKEVENLEDVDIENFIYSINNDKYNIYIGITSNKENYEKLKEIFIKEEYIVSGEKIFVDNKEFIQLIKQYDNLLKEVTDETVIMTINKTILDKYKELVINDN